MKGTAVHLVKRIVIFVVTFVIIGGAAGILSIMFVFNVHGGLLPLNIAPLGYVLEAVAAALISWRVACIVVPKRTIRDSVI
jgi:hypothetical protein